METFVKKQYQKMMEISDLKQQLLLGVETREEGEGKIDGDAIEVQPEVETNEAV